MNTLIIFVLLLLLMLTGMPISISLGLTVLTFLFTLTDVPIESVALKLFTGIEKFEVMAIPFFILAGNFLTHGGVAKRMINFCTSMIGHWYGGMGLAGVMACALFAAISGSSVATVVAVGSIMLPAMVKAGYPKRFGAGVITTSGALGILFPPSINLVMYAIATAGMNATGPNGEPVSSASVGQLFLAGVVPGLCLSFLLGVTTWWRAKKYDYPRMPRATWGERWRAFRESMWGLLLIVVVIGGIYSGLFTPTEAAAMAAVYAFFISVFVYKDLKLSDVPKSLLSAAAMSSMLLYIITNAVLFSFLMTSEQIPQAMAAWMTSQGFRPGGVPAAGQHHPAGRRQLHGPGRDRADHGAHPVPCRDQAGRRPGALRHPDGGQHGGGPVPSAGRPEPLRGLGDHEDGHHRAHGRGRAVAADDDRLPDRRDLLADAVAVAAAPDVQVTLLHP